MFYVWLLLVWLLILLFTSDIAAPSGLNGDIYSDRAIPSTNLDLHFAHCSRNLEKCKICEDMVPRKFAEEHFLSTHAPVCDLICLTCYTLYHWCYSLEDRCLHSLVHVESICWSCRYCLQLYMNTFVHHLSS